ncbi:MAG: GNAT family N-acetyltransferase [Bacteroidetes bacterium]|nr:GNAT family N-acetyltransferase [Bacteroidota bacterium]MDA1335261.1 GNAT family N-acetyltransferase [Bacteroidota bacterium]
MTDLQEIRGPFVARAISPAETRYIRHSVLWPHKESFQDCVIDIDGESHAHHVGAFDSNGFHVGVCSLFLQRSERFPEAIPVDDSVYRLRVMATIPEVRGLGAGATIVDYACAWARSKGVAWIWCDARKVAFGFYERMGFEFVSDFYEIDPIGPHRMMARKL